MSEGTQNKPPVFKISFFYGWLILALVCCVGFVRQAPAVATLSIFVNPMIDEFGWSRLGLSGAVSLGGVLAAIVSPMIGSFMDRHGPRVILCFAVVLTGIACLSLSLSQDLIFFYIFFCIARMSFAGPFDLGIYGVVNNWFIRRRPFATAIANLFQAFGLACMPLIASTAILWGDWRTGWLTVGIVVFSVGLIPTYFLKPRRPEDIGLFPDGDLKIEFNAMENESAIPSQLGRDFSRASALRTRGFWMLSLFTLFVFPVQAGVSLHQAPHLLQLGFTATESATVVSLFSLSAAGMTLLTGLLGRKFSLSTLLAISGAFLCLSTFLMLSIETFLEGLTCGMIFGAALGAILTLLPVAWADFFGRKNYGAIRGLALAIQVVAQAAGPLISGILWDLEKNYFASLELFTVFSFCAFIVAFFAQPPKKIDS